MCKTQNLVFGNLNAFDIQDVLYDNEKKEGYCVLVSGNKKLSMNFYLWVPPYNSGGLLGAPYPTNFIYCIYDMNGANLDKSLYSLEGQFFFKQNAGTLPNNSSLNIPYGEYSTFGRFDKSCKGSYLTFSLQEGNMKLFVN